MSELLLEFFSEEIPARMQARAEADLVRLMTEKLSAAGLSPDSLEGFAGPRRLGLVASGLPAQTADVREERKGPRVGAPDKAIEGFLRGAGLESLDQCKVEESKKGSFYVAIIEKPGRKTTEVIAEAVPEIVKSFPWPKSMKFGEGDKAQRWVRPLHRITAVFDGKVVPFAVFGIESGNTTEGHRIHSKGDRVFTVDSFADYAAKLADNGVVLKRADRERQVLDGAKRVCADAQLELVEDEGLLAEVAGLVEHPVPVLGEMDPAFLDLPPEVITLTMKVHQKYFAVRDSETGKLAPKFVMIANQDAPDGGKAIAAGAARVLSARLSDARHFWDLDRKRGLEAMASELSKVTFHEKLGTVADKVERVAALARELAPVVGADADMAEKAARLCKADLVSQMVYEFPELQGAMGRYYALEAGLDEQIADAIKDHYKPQGPSDAVPTAPVSAAVALADKLDTLVGFWAIDEKPTGSKDPFALRRAALGDIKVLADGIIRLSLGRAIHFGMIELATRQYGVPRKVGDILIQNLWELDWVESQAKLEGLAVTRSELESLQEWFSAREELIPDLLSFFADRLKVHLKDEGVRFDVIDAVFALGDDDLVRVTKKARALQGFLETGDGAALLAGYRRAANILKAEEKKGFDLTAARAEALSEISAAVDASEKAHAPETGEQDEAAILVAVAKTSQAAEEKALIAAIEGAETVAQAALAKEDFEGAMRALAGLRAPVDSFFDAVVVNVDNDDKLRRNRLLLLSRIRASVERVADFGKLEG
ncbi:glycine--tRNA ligase subunit beta [Marinicauda pacifica]|uniref:glycine--tRNA ligase subunit beta n=1 Tax=Marinicauda pacifica TaxID=1133559 RepID=UPI0035C83B83